MATFNNGINGGFTGKVGSIVAYPLHGKWVMRSVGKPSAKNKKGSPKQKSCRSGFTMMQTFLRPLIPFIRVGFNLEGKLRQMTAHNVAKSYNMLNAQEANGDIDYTKVCLTFGRLLATENATVQRDDAGLHFSWTNNACNNWIRETDQVMLVAYNAKEGSACFKLSGARRSDGFDTLEVPTKQADSEFHTWISFIADDRESIAMSSYVGKI